MEPFLVLLDDTVQLLLAHAETFWTNHPNYCTIFEVLHCAMTALVSRGKYDQHI